MARRIPNDLTVGQVSERAGVPVSTLHYYEEEGLIQSWRTPANHRRFDRIELRRIAVIRVAQSVGVPLAEIKEVLDGLPRDRKIKKAEWEAVSAIWRDRLEERIADLERLRDQLGFCIGCGCLSLKSCPLYNPQDALAEKGAGPRRWHGDSVEAASAASDR